MSQPHDRVTPSQSPAAVTPRNRGRLPLAHVPPNNRFHPHGGSANRSRGSTRGRVSNRGQASNRGHSVSQGGGLVPATPEGGRPQWPNNEGHESANSGWAGATFPPPDPVLDPALNWLGESQPSPTSENFINPGGSNSEGSSDHEDRSSYDPLPDAPALTWGAAPPPPNQETADTAVGGSLVGELQGRLHLSESNLALANRLFRATESEKWGLTVLMFVHLLGKTSDATVSNPLSAPTPEAKNFTFSTHLKAYVQSQSPSFHKDYLPPGYPRDISASAKVLKLMRGLLKTEKCLLRTLLLHNIKEHNHRPIDGAVPDLDGLVLIIDTFMAARKQARTVADILRSYPASVRTRLAFLRLYVVVHLIHRDPKENISQWELIDQQLEYVKGQSELYRIAYGRVVEAIDKELFGHGVKFEDMDHEDIRVPTDEDVEEEIRVMSASGGSTGESSPFC
ncbi:uncharacterized protein PGTG_15880 [Puccinia graminis f. sp. tritici CRL 75-36-700-3]|uniref:Uncharacterized protein n=1 Tax=Puccinia graminis f. sp. tritici (strain CRL 75-36-700-3 / race SCCL) TaxID=418459 RepID=E3L0D4_PUCGT|nr:uncharacterized protein PGTG_15880 [Puccinia graminis f. sp. tritici CRL 75-36-700-3]EFP90032.1 hypothetical protein PGTG_15880 [Puccinia graminis f. sp. tritici CRL 75-36-700-3]